MDRALLLACVICGILFSVLGLASFFILWAVNWRPWRIYRYLVVILCFCLPVLTWCFGFVCSFKIQLPCCNVNAVDFFFFLLRMVFVGKISSCFKIIYNLIFTGIGCRVLSLNFITDFQLPCFFVFFDGLLSMAVLNRVSR